MQQQANSQNRNPVQNPNIILKSILVIVFLGFITLTVLAILNDGVLKMFSTQLGTIGGIQIFIDLVIMCLIFSVWMKNDAKKNNRYFLPWFLLTLAAGSIGPLLYLITAKKKD